MNAYTVSRLALDAGVSVHIVRDYLLRGLLRPVACTPGGYGLFDDAALQRLCFVRAAFEAGIGLEALADLEVQLATLPTEPAQHAESLP
ncbi:TPA: mercuric resistance transcriptional repressor protein MerD [Proteus mirabilis]|nr:mercuric resistance transcriptional repressor protein MerD [Proteus mirabilis]